MKDCSDIAIKPGVKELTIEYFKVDVFSEPLTPETRKNIIDTFTYAYNNHLSIQAIVMELKGSNLCEMRERIIKRLGSNYNPFPLRLGETKPILQMKALEVNKSLHGYILSILRESAGFRQ